MWALAQEGVEVGGLIAVIGGHAQVGVPVGTGSSAVAPPGGYAATMKIGGPGDLGNDPESLPAAVITPSRN
jgi:hypothetical protein